MAERNWYGKKDKGKDSVKSEEKGPDTMHDRHARERGETHERHGKEREDMHKRHEEETANMDQRQDEEMQAAPETPGGAPAPAAANNAAPGAAPGQMAGVTGASAA